MKTNIKTTGTVCNTSGRGKCSSEKRAVGIMHIELNFVSYDKTYGYIKAFFKASDWNVAKHGLIYTDAKWLAEFRKACTSLGLSGRDVDYSDRSAQGATHVDLCVGKKFLETWEKVTGCEVELDYYGGSRD